MKRHIIRIRSKIRQTAAFTLAEALVATIIMLLVSAIMAAGIPAAIRAYDNVVIASNAEMLMSTAMSELRNELSTATEISESSDGGLIFYNERAGFMSKIYCLETTNEKGNKVKDIMYQRYYSGKNDKDSMISDAVTSGSDGTSSAQKLMSDAVSDKKHKLHVYFEADPDVPGDKPVVYDKEGGFVEFKNIKVMRDNGKDTAAKRDSYKIRVLADTD